jgi:hypothetical protein
LTPFTVLSSTFSAPSSLVRLLSDTVSVPVDVSRQDFAEQLSQWLGALDAVTLHGTHQSLKSVVGSSPLGASPHSPAALEAHFQRVRSALVARVSEPVRLPDGAHEGGQSASRLLRAAAEAPLAAGEASFAPYRQHCQALQRHMGLKIATLRAQVRQVLSHGAAPLRQLAELDAVWEQMLTARETKLLGTVPAVLEQRFEHLRRSGAPEPLARYAHEQQAVLLAELNVRLLPVAGLVEAFAQHHHRPESLS